MLADLDQSVAAFLDRLLPAGTAIRFGPPALSWADGAPEAPLLDAFPYDIRETQPPVGDGTLARVPAATRPDGSPQSAATGSATC